MGNSDDTNQTDTTEQEIDRFFAILGKLAGLQNTETKPTAADADDKPPKYEVHELDQTMIDRLLLSPSELENVKGRLLATGVGETIRQFVDHERERASNIGLVMLAINELGAMMLGSMIAQSAKDKPASAKLHIAMVGVFSRHLSQVIQLGWTKARRR
jgi:hypothetical protein